MARPVGQTTNPLHERRAEWGLVRQTALLGDVVDEDGFRAMLNVPLKTLRTQRSKGEWYGIEIPKPIYRPDGQKAIWLKKEAEAFAIRFNAARATRRK